MQGTGELENLYFAQPCIRTNSHRGVSMWLCLRNNIEGQEQPTTSCLRIPSDSFASRPIDVAHDLADGIEVGSFVTRTLPSQEKQAWSLNYDSRKIHFYFSRVSWHQEHIRRRDVVVKNMHVITLCRLQRKRTFSVPGKRAPKGFGINRIVTSFLYNHLE